MRYVGAMWGRRWMSGIEVFKDDFARAPSSWPPCKVKYHKDRRTVDETWRRPADALV